MLIKVSAAHRGVLTGDFWMLSKDQSMFQSWHVQNDHDLNILYEKINYFWKGAVACDMGVWPQKPDLIKLICCLRSDTRMFKLTPIWPNFGHVNWGK